MKAKLVIETLNEFHKTGNPLDALGIGPYQYFFKVKEFLLNKIKRQNYEIFYPKDYSCLIIYFKDGYNAAWRFYNRLHQFDINNNRDIDEIFKILRKFNMHINIYTALSQVPIDIMKKDGINVPNFGLSFAGQNNNFFTLVFNSNDRNQ